MANFLLRNLKSTATLLRSTRSLALRSAVPKAGAKRFASTIQIVNNARVLGTTSTNRLGLDQSRSNPHQTQQCASLSTSAGPDPAFEDLVEMAEAHLDILLNEKLMWAKQLVMIRETPHEDVMKRWQMALQVFVASQAHTLVSYGYAPDMSGIHQHMTDYVEATAKHERGQELLSLQNDRWNAVLQQAFGIGLGDSGISVEQARHYSGMLALKLQSKEFLSKVDDAVATLPSSGTEEEIQVQKHTFLMELLSPLHKELGDSFGFPGDAGFIKLQVALLDHQRDDQVIYNTMGGMMAVFKRAGIEVPQA